MLHRSLLIAGHWGLFRADSTLFGRFVSGLSGIDGRGIVALLFGAAPAFSVKPGSWRMIPKMG